MCIRPFLHSSRALQNIPNPLVPFSCLEACLKELVIHKLCVVLPLKFGIFQTNLEKLASFQGHNANLRYFILDDVDLIDHTSFFLLLLRNSYSVYIL